ncbi:hypothetical protein LCGC14_0366920 [marine sediment metagenome]|uniref:Uncharacterized protein n=1 Tax=marine sediment metagenome TaxID=412755 RepID=A0A0F9VTB1_9ZZZZ
MADRTCIYMSPYNAPLCSECGHDLSLCECVDPDALAHERLHSIDGLIFTMVRDELVADRTADPDTVHLLGTLMEKLGLLSIAMARHDRGLSTTTQEVLREAVRVATMAIRVASEGDSNYSYVFPAVETELPAGPTARQY